MERNLSRVRIYKVPTIEWRTYLYNWSLRSNGCDAVFSRDCNHGYDHDGHCNDFYSFDHVLYNLNTPNTELTHFLNTNQ